MKVFNLSENTLQTELKQRQEDNRYFIVATRQEFLEIGKLLGAHTQPLLTGKNLDENIRFESYPDYDFLSFVYFDFDASKFEFETFSLYYSKQYVALVVEQDEGLHTRIIQEFDLETFKRRSEEDNLVYIYYKFLDNAFTRMFAAMCRYETTLAGMEDDIMMQQKDFEFERIVALKNNSFNMKKYLRLLLYVGDQLLVNDNGLIPEKQMPYFRNIDMRINRMYEYAASIHEVSEHLMELYNSAVNAKTNDLINKLTIFTVFATPITVLTGLYGMNFVNMPELQHQYGYFIFLGVICAILLTTYLILKKIKLL